MRSLIALVLFSGICQAQFPIGAKHPQPKQGYWGNRALAYSEQDGWAVVEGDILLAPLAEITAQPRPRQVPDRLSAVVTDSYRIWPNATVAYVLDATFPAPDRVLDAMKHWEERTPVRFVPRTNEGTYVTIRQTWSGCSATVGAAGNTGVVNLSSGCDTTAVIHELGHTIGLYHTQSRVDRDRYLRVRYDNISPAYWSQYDQQFLDSEDSGPYDYMSIMHYSVYGFSRAGGVTMQSIPAGIPVGQGRSTTALDIQAVHKLYGKRLQQTIISSTPTGLLVLVDGKQHATPAAFDWADGETHTIAPVEPQELETDPASRYRFALWSDGGDPEHTITVSADARVIDARFRRYYRMPASDRLRITPASEDGYYPTGSILRLEALPAEGETFVRWSQPARDIDRYPEFQGLLHGLSPNPLEITLDEPQPELVPVFSKRPVVSLESTSPGLLLFVDDELYTTPACFDWEPGTKHSVEPAVYYTLDEYVWDHFLNWKEKEGETLQILASDQPQTFTAESERLLYLDLNYDYRLRSSDTAPYETGFTVSPPGYYGYQKLGAEVTVTPPANEGWRLANWYRDGSGAVPLSFRMDTFRYLVGNFLYPWALNAGAIVNDASGQPGPVSPGERLRIHWYGDVPAEPLQAPEGGTLPTILGGVQVGFGRLNAPLLRVSKDEIVCLVPEGVSDYRSLNVVVKNGRIGTHNVERFVITRSPGLYTADRSGFGPALARAVATGEALELRATGLTDKESAVLLVDEQAAPATLEASATEPGIWLVRATVPAAARPGVRAVYLLNGGRSTQTGVTLEVSAPPPPPAPEETPAEQN